MLHPVRDSAVDPNRSRPRPSSPNSCIISHVLTSCHSWVEYTLLVNSGDHAPSALPTRPRKACRASDHCANAATTGRMSWSVVWVVASRVRSGGFLPILLLLSEVVSPPYKAANALCVKAGPHASLGCTRGSHWFQSGSCKAMGICRALRSPSGRKMSGVIWGTGPLRLRAFPAELIPSLRWRIRYCNASLSWSRTQVSPAPAAQLEIGCSSSPGPGWYGGFHGRPGGGGRQV